MPIFPEPSMGAGQWAYKGEEGRNGDVETGRPWAPLTLPNGTLTRGPLTLPNGTLMRGPLTLPDGTLMRGPLTLPNGTLMNGGLTNGFTTKGKKREY